MMSYAWATIVSPMKMIASRIDIVVIVLAAFFASGGLNAWHPVRDRLDAGQRDRARRERLEEQEEAEGLGPERLRVRLAGQRMRLARRDVEEPGRPR